MKICATKPSMEMQILSRELLVLHVSSSKLASRQRIKQNIMAVGPFASWAVVLYDRSSTEQWLEAKLAAGRVGTEFVVRRGTLPTAPAKTMNGKPFYPKMLFWLQAMDLIAKHNFVWLADEDMSFRNFPIDAYWHRLTAAFGKRGPPVISQPTITARATLKFGDPRGKWREFLNAAEFWDGSGVVAAETSYVEQQAAVVDARFFVREGATWEALARAQHAHGSDFALDSLWCGGATLFAPARVACAVVTIPIEHDDTRVLNWTSDESFKKRSRELEKQAYTELAPSWWDHTQRLRIGLFVREMALLEASEFTCLETRAQASNVFPAAETRRYASATALPCQLTQLRRFPMVYNRLGDIVLDAATDAKLGTRARQRVSLTRNQTAVAELMHKLARSHSPVKACCTRGSWKCCF